MTWELRALLLAALGLSACGPVVATVDPGGTVEPAPENDYGVCDPVVIDELDRLPYGASPETYYVEYLRCTDTLDHDACMSDCDADCQQQEVGQVEELQDSLTWAYVTCGPMWLDGECCVSVLVEDFCCEGRPFLVDGEARVAEIRGRTDWSAELQPRDVPAATAELLAAHWMRAGQQEHASVAAFSRFSLVLLHLGAPAELVEDTHVAALDEVRHARACFALASTYAGRSLGPGPLPVDDALAGELDPTQVLRTLFIEGCVGESTASLRAQIGASKAEDPVVAQVLERIAADEARHAALAWRTVRWLLETYPELRRELEALLAGSPSLGVTSDPAGLQGHGVLGPADCEAISRDAHRRVVQEVGQALLAELAPARSGVLA